MRIAILSNITTNMFVDYFKKENEVYSPPGFNTWKYELINPESGFYKYKPDVLLVLIDGTSYYNSLRNGDIDTDVHENFNIFFNVSNKLKSTAIFISSLDVRRERIDILSNGNNEFYLEYIWLKKTSEIISSCSNVYKFDIKALSMYSGHEKFYSPKMFYLTSTPYSIRGIELISKKFNRCIKALREERKKCLITDLDNTLWGGVISEDGLDGIILSDHQLGKQYYDLQRRILEIKNTGIVLAVVSKNNYEDAILPFRNHPCMLLKEEDFVYIKANWENKAKNIIDLSKELNIGLDSMVFLDDSPMERELIKNQLPDVTVIDFPNDTANLPKLMIDVFEEYFYVLKITEEDKNKTEAYKNEKSRKEDQIATNSIDEFIKSLKIELNIHEMYEDEIARVAQLIQKTNQFNLTTKRYTESEIYSFFHSLSCNIITVNVKDKYGEYGLVAIVILKYDTINVEIDSFLMSCRVMGRKIEESIMEWIEGYLRAKDVRIINANYIGTQKNVPVESFYDSIGYELLEQSNEPLIKKYRKELR